MSKELTPLEALESIIDTFYNKNTDDIKIVRKALKALEIITKSFDFDVELGSLHDGTPTYKLNVWCKGTPTVVKPISKEQFDLLKEVLK